MRAFAEVVVSLAPPPLMVRYLRTSYLRVCRLAKDLGDVVRGKL